MRISYRTIALALLATALAGCGGNSAEPSATPVKFTISWAARARSINAPSSALSAELVLEGARPGGGQFRYVLNRPDGSSAQVLNYTSDQPATLGQHTMVMRFHAAANGTGDVVGVAGDVVEIKMDGTGIGSVYTEGNVADVQVPTGQTVTENSRQTLAVSARDASGQLIAVSAGSIFWSVASGAEILKFENGEAVGLLHGEAQVVATVDSRTSRPATVSVKVGETALLVPTLLGASDSGENFLTGMSADGRWVCGGSDSPQGRQAYRWGVGTAEPEPLGFLPGSTFASFAYGMSDDGQTVVGISSDGDVATAFIWRAGQGMTPVPDMPPTAEGSEALAVSADGKTVVGSYYVADSQFGFIWNEQRGFTTFRDIDQEPDAPSHCQAVSVNGDGSAVLFNMAWMIDHDNKDKVIYQPAVWRLGSGLQALGGGDVNRPEAMALDISRSGQIVLAVISRVGRKDFYPAKWTAANGWVPIAPNMSTVPHDICVDGSRIVGGGVNNGEAFVYDSTLGYQNMLNVMEAKGMVDQIDSTPVALMACSADGLVMGGDCRQNNVRQRGFIIRLNR